MLDYSELTVVKNSNGIPTALGYPINSFMLQNNKPLFVGGGKKKAYENQAYENQAYENQAYENQSYDNLAVPAGLVCMTETRCMRADSYPIDENSYDTIDDAIEDEREIVPEGLYERLLELAEVKERKKMTKKHKPKAKSSTKKHKKN
jgi:hypothetical protein